jgi:hypothetical protein
MRLLEAPTGFNTSPRGDPKALIEEARARTRRRRSLIATAVLVLTLGALLAAVITGGNGRGTSFPHPAPPAATNGIVRMLNLSSSDRYESLAVVNGRLLLSGGPGGSLVHSASDAAQTPAQLNACHSAVVDLATLRLTDLKSGACENPSLYGETVLPINDVALGVPNGSTIRIAVAEKSAKGYRVGPVVLRYGEFNDTDAEWAYGDGFLWIYEPLVTASTGQLLRVSEQTGAVLQRVSMPQIVEPTIAVNDDGLWLASGVPLANSTSGLYHVAPGMRAAIRVGNLEPTWIAASGNTLWLATSDPAGELQHLRVIEGSTLQPAKTSDIMSAVDRATGGPEDAPGYGVPGYAIDAHYLWFADPPQESPPSGSFKGSETESVFRASLGNGAWSTIATLQPKLGYGFHVQDDPSNRSYRLINTTGVPTSGVAVDSPAWTTQSLSPEVPIVTLGDSAYVLDPPAHGVNHTGGFSGFSALYQIRPKQT